jgi:hypothetical protein
MPTLNVLEPLDPAATSFLRTARWRGKLGMAVTAVEFAIVTGSLALLAFSLYHAVPAFLLLRGYRPIEGDLLTRMLTGTLAVLAVVLVPFIYVLMYLLPFVLTLPFSAPVIGLWEAPPRFLLLRPFNRGPVSGPLRKVVRREMGPLGHVYTLSDADLRIPWYVRMPLLLAQVALLSFRMRKIRSPQQAERLEAVMDRVWLRNVNWCLSFTKAFPIASADGAWKDVVRHLAKRVDAVVIDATELRPNVRWEVALCRRIRRLHRVVVLVREDVAPEVLIELRQLAPELVEDGRVFCYSMRGLATPDLFRARLTSLARSGLLERRGRDGTPSPGWRDRCAVALFSASVFPLLALADHGLGVFPRWNEWDGPWPGIAGVSNPSALAVYGAGVLTLILLLVGGRRHPTLLFLGVVQVLLLLAAPIGMSGW